jgi:hypothetical protein
VNVSEAARLINNDMAFWEGWRFSASPVSFSALHVEVEIDTVDTSYPDADGRCRSQKITLLRDFLIRDVGSLDENGIAYRVLKSAAEISEHEDREALKIRQPDGTWRAPLHPHTMDGELGWRTREGATA